MNDFLQLVPDVGSKRQRTYVTVHGAISGDDIWPQLKRDRRDGGSAYRGQLARDRIGVQHSRPMCCSGMLASALAAANAAVRPIRCTLL
jgi:hypothetical protein